MKFVPAGLALHHVAIVVNDLSVAAARYEALGFAGSERIAVPDQAIEAIVFAAGNGQVELIAPTDPAGPIARYLGKRGEGLHHVAYEVANIEATLADLAARGVRLIDSAPRIGLHGSRVAFIHPESCAGVLTELVEPPR